MATQLGIFIFYLALTVGFGAFGYKLAVGGLPMESGLIGINIGLVLSSILWQVAGKFSVTA